MKKIKEKIKGKINGLYTALITPFDAKGKLDEAGLRTLIHHQLEAKVDGIVVLGTTGESPTLTQQEKERIIRIAVEEIKDKVPVVVGTGTYSTQETIESSKKAEQLGATMVMAVVPYYNKPTQEGMFLHFKAVAEAIKIPVIVYNVQGRCSVNMQTETLKRLAALPGIVGVKEASANMQQISDVIETISRHHPNFGVISGDDAWTLPLMALGGDGILSVVSNLIPAQVKALVQALQQEDFKRARDLHFQLMPFFRHAFIETNPIPIKAAMEEWGLPAGKCRLPLCELQPESAKKLRATLKELRAVIAKK